MADRRSLELLFAARRRLAGDRLLQIGVHAFIRLRGTAPKPDEGINGDLKQAVPRRAPARSKQQLKRAAISHMRRLAKMPKRIRSIFQHQQFRYAA